MLKLRIFKSGSDPQVYEFPSDEAVIGRAPGCDVVLKEAYVSKRHAKVLAGVVVVDLGSANGTHVNGVRLTEAVALPGGDFKLGTEATDVRIEVEHDPVGVLDLPQVVRVRQELDTERRKSAALAAELARGAAPKGAPEPADGVAEGLRRELRDAKKRLESLKKEVEERDVSASEGVQVRLAQDALTEALRAKEALELQVQELRSGAAGPAVEAAKRALAARVAELEADDAELRERIRRLEADAAAAKAGAEPMPNISSLFFKLQAENRELRSQLEKKAGSGGEAPALFFELQAANLELKRKLAELQSQGGGAKGSERATAEPDVAKLNELRKEIHELRMSKADMLSELESLRVKAGASPEPEGRSRPPAGARGAASERALEVLHAVVEEDVENKKPLLDGDLLPFVTLELFRFLRQVERLVTRMASDFIQLYDQQTILPDVSGNLRALVGAVLDESEDDDARPKLVGYLDEMRRWLVVALGANRRAAERFVEEVRSDLSERALTAGKPIPALKKFAGMADAELWSRASEYLKRLTADVVEERMQHHCRTCAEEIRREQGRGS